MESEDHLLMEEINMIIITYLFLLRPGEHTVSKSESTIFHLKYTAYSCGLIVFEATNTEFNLSAGVMTSESGVEGVAPCTWITRQRKSALRHKRGSPDALCPIFSPLIPFFCFVNVGMTKLVAWRLNSVFVASKTMRLQL